MKNNEEIEILIAIKNCQIPIGAKHLSEQLNIPSATIGRKLLLLEKEGYLEKNSNKGRQITKAGLDYINHFEQLNTKLIVANDIITNAKDGSWKSLYEVMKIRLLLEPYIVELACKNVSENGLYLLETINLENTQVLKQGAIGNVQDLEFHLAIAKESGNQILLQILQLILTQNNAYTKFSEAAPQLTIKQVYEHTEILLAIQKRDSEKAKKAMKKHLTRIISDIKTHYEQ